ncbi:alpha/beta fold hydrolase [Roseivirga sp. E12]|uniref:alpha/beta fold hydrolase n=1 Tax=Roseivirga sp. E12 TaxID=2819237 RepID=UPI001ABD4793|nr:alpha/beta hydrolase [Roseivirga sp. E12]MBO3699365.1 alpha/beta hydrolase [Roseivirga sp. E12]
MKKQLILLHGALGYKGDFDPIVPLLSANFEIFSFNFSGHGQQSFSADGFGIEIFAQELEDFIKKNGLVRPSVFGYSMGGYVALYLATINKEVLGKILTLGTKFEWTPESAHHETSRMNPDVMAEKIPAYTVVLQAAHGKGWKTLVEQTAGMMIELGESPLLTKDSLSSIEIPIGIKRGEKDHMVSEEESRLAASHIPGAKFSIVPATKHPINTVNPSVLARLIKSELS